MMGGGGSEGSKSGGTPVPGTGISHVPKAAQRWHPDERHGRASGRILSPASFLSIFMIIETTEPSQLSFYSVVNKNSPGGSPDEIPPVNHILSYDGWQRRAGTSRDGCQIYSHQPPPTDGHDAMLFSHCNVNCTCLLRHCPDSGTVQRPDKSVSNTDTSRAILERLVPRFLNYPKRNFKMGFII